MDIVYITPRGILKTRPELAPGSYAWYLQRCNNNTPQALTTQETDRGALETIYKARDTWISFSSDAVTAVEQALREANQPTPPIRVPTDFEHIGLADTVKDENNKSSLVARESVNEPEFKLTKGNKYEIRMVDIRYTRTFQRKKMHVSKDGDSMYSKVHDIALKGVDAALRVKDDRNRYTYFRQNNEDVSNEKNEMDVWKYFEKPHIDTVKEVYPARYQSNLDALEVHEALNEFTFYPGQRDFIARVACLDSAAVCSETGCGKSLKAIALSLIMGAKRTLLIAPKGTVKTESGETITYDPAQWVAEFNKFAPEIPVHTIFREKDYLDLCNRPGGFPNGVFISYPTALFNNEGAFEYMPNGNGWNRSNSEKKFRERMGLYYDEENPPVFHEFIHTGVGEQHRGIHCLARPSLATKMGNIWDMVILDEAHLIGNLATQITRSLIRLQPKFKFALTATPIPNIIYNIFPILGWLCVKDWYAGGRRNHRWPYAINDLDKFKATFVSKERDTTEDAIRIANGKGLSTAKDSPIISQSSRLLKLLKPTIAHISKEDCNPALPECKVFDVRVPMGAQQHKAYTKYLDPTNIPHNNPLVIMAKQQQWLRGICASPADLEYATDVVSNFNPKTVATLELISECLGRDEQVIHVAARTSQNNELQRRLEEAGIEVARIDSTMPKHSVQANRFKRGEAKVMLMGIKCAQGDSFENCRNLIVGSLEWSYGAFNQAQGRIFRLNSPKTCNIYVVLHGNSIEELLFDKLGHKQDAATLCLYGKNIPKEFKPTNASELMADHIMNYDPNRTVLQDESVCELKWEKVKNSLVLSTL